MLFQAAQAILYILYGKQRNPTAYQPKPRNTDKQTILLVNNKIKYNYKAHPNTVFL